MGISCEVMSLKKKIARRKKKKVTFKSGVKNKLFFRMFWKIDKHGKITAVLLS